MSTKLGPEQRRTVAAWSLYDFANSSFTTLVVTFMYSTYFVKGIASDELVGTSQWSKAVTATALIIAVASPYVGAVADRGGHRKLFLLISTIVAVVGSVVLFFPLPGQVRFALVVFVVANVAFELANVFYNAYLPDIAPRELIGRISGIGWALGYGGGLLCLVVALFVFVNPEVAPFGLDKETGGHIRATNLLVAAWYGLFSIPVFLVLRDRRGTASDIPSLFRQATRQIAGTFREIARYRQIVRLLVARLIYNDGLVTIFAFGGIYAAGTFGFSFSEITVFGIALNLAAGVGAYMFGFLDDRIGGKKTILITLAGLTIATAFAFFAIEKWHLWGAGILVGLLVGPNQSASRSLMGRFVPETKENELYGFFAFSGKATSFLGPLLFGQLTIATGTQRAGIAVVAAFFLVGGLLMLRVDEEEGLAALDPDLTPPVD